MIHLIHSSIRSIFTLLLLLFFAGAVQANPLQDILELPEMKGMPRHNRRDSTAELLPYVDPQSNYGAFVLETREYSSLESWLQPIPAGYKVLKTRIRRYHQYSEFTQIYHSKQNEFDFFLKVFVPQPKFIDSVKMGIIRQFAELAPPILPIESSEELTVSGDIPAALYNRKDGLTSLLIRLPRGSLMNLVCTKVEAVSEMIQLANLLNVKEVRDKLAS